MSNILEINGVSKFYANHTALNKVDLQISSNRIFGLLGPNGAGKTSLIRIINQITGPDQGEVIFDREILKPAHQKHIGYLPEERGLYKKMKVGEQALYLAQLKGMSKSEAMASLKEWFLRFEIADWWNKRIDELSKGMQQKVQFIVTVMHKPKLLILDEPFSGFDPINAALIRDEILKLRDEGTTVILSTHNMASVEEICDDIALIYKSNKILEGSIDKVKEERSGNEYRVNYSGDHMAFTKALWIDAELKENNTLKTDTHSAVIKLAEGKTPNDLLKAVIPHVSVTGLEKVVPSMNDIFIGRVNEINQGADE